MAITRGSVAGPTFAGTGNDSGDPPVTSISLTIGGSGFSGQVVVLIAWFGSIGTTGTPSVTDSQGNTYTAVTLTNGTGAGLAVNFRLFAVDLGAGTALTSADTITATFSGGSGSYAVSLQAVEYHGMARGSGTNTGATEGSLGTTSGGLVSTTAGGGQLHTLGFAVMVRLANADNDDPTGSVFTPAVGSPFSFVVAGDTGALVHTVGHTAGAFRQYTYDLITSTYAGSVGSAVQLTGNWSPVTDFAQYGMIGVTFQAQEAIALDQARTLSTDRQVTAEIRNQDYGAGLGGLYFVRWNAATPPAPETTLSVDTGGTGAPTLIRAPDGRLTLVYTAGSTKVRSSLTEGRSWGSALTVTALGAIAAEIDRLRGLLLFAGRAFFSGTLKWGLQVGKQGAGAWTFPNANVALTSSVYSSEIVGGRGDLFRDRAGRWWFAYVDTGDAVKLLRCKSLSATGAGTWTAAVTAATGYQGVAALLDPVTGLLLLALFKSSEMKWYLRVGETSGDSFSFAHDATDLVTAAAAHGRLRRHDGIEFVYVKSTNGVGRVACRAVAAADANVFS